MKLIEAGSLGLRFVIEIVSLDVVPATIVAGVKLLLTAVMSPHAGEEKTAATTVIKLKKANGNRPHLRRFIVSGNLANSSSPPSNFFVVW
ncbi:MAG: hypothetical protein NT087_03465 [Deltaproteobacteria bacterium]|nr:hypothetical protein [Deltaproteobacteria bacterium]